MAPETAQQCIQADSTQATRLGPALEGVSTQVLTDWATLSRLLHLSGPQFPPCTKGGLESGLPSLHNEATMEDRGPGGDPWEPNCSRVRTIASEAGALLPFPWFLVPHPWGRSRDVALGPSPPFCCARRRGTSFGFKSNCVKSHSPLGKCYVWHRARPKLSKCSVVGGWLSPKAWAPGSSSWKWGADPCPWPAPTPLGP